MLFLRIIANTENALKSGFLGVFSYIKLKIGANKKPSSLFEIWAFLFT